MKKDTGILLLLGATHSLNQTLGIIATISFLIYGGGALVGGPLSDYLFS